MSSVLDLLNKIPSWLQKFGLSDATSMSVIDQQPENAFSPMLLKLAETVMLVREPQTQNASLPTLVTPAGIVTSVRDLHP